MSEAPTFPGRVVFGGPLSPVGWTVGFVEAPLASVVEAMQAHDVAVRGRDLVAEYIEELRAEGVVVARHYGPLAERAPAEPEYRYTQLDAEPILQRLRRLDPLQSPSMRELVVEHGDGWTANLQNDHLGGDSLSWMHNACKALGCRGVVATHIPIGHYPYPATQLEFRERGAGGVTERAISAGIFDEGRWRFDVHGEVQPFEDPSRYGRRRIHERFDRDLLLRYLRALGIDADDEDAYGDAVLVLTVADWKPRTSTIEATQREYGILPPARRSGLAFWRN